MKPFHQQQHQAEQEQYAQERETMLQQHEQSKARRRKKAMIISATVLGLALLASGGWAGLYFLTAGPYDDFAKCLTDKGAVMYGAIEWCKYTQGQAHMFGKSFKYINYHDQSELPGIKTRPTWVINGKWYEKVQSFETLSALTGCPL